MRLSHALRARRGDVIALVGAGGKTAALFRLADELTAARWHVVTTASTHLATDQLARAPAALRAWEAGSLERLPPLLRAHGHILVMGEPAAEPGRVSGPPPEVLAMLAAHPDVDVLLVEADGSRQRPLKAPAPHEPAIPPWATLVVVVAGLSGLGQPLTAEVVHRPDRFAALSTLTPGSPITPEAVARVLTHAEGGLHHVPAGARVVALLNQVESDEHLAAGRAIAQEALAGSGLDEVILATLQADDPVIEAHGRVAGIVLAAGSSTRFGQPKLLLPWGSATLIEHVVQQAQMTGLGALLVVVGAAGDQVAQAVAGRARVVHNPGWASGQSSSMQAGLNALPPDAAAALFILADQPDVRPDVVQALIARWHTTRAPIVAPRYQGQRGNPVLFDREVFPELMALRGDVGGRPLIAHYGQHVAWVDVDAPPPLDVDTPEVYEQALRTAFSESSNQRSALSYQQLMANG